MKQGNNLSNTNLSDEHFNRARKEYEDEVEDESMERVYYSDQDEYFLTPNSKTKIKPKTQIETQPQTQTETKSKVVVPCSACGEKIKNDFALQTHMNEHWRENIAATSDYDIKSSFNQQQLKITNVTNFYKKLIKNIIETADYILDEVKPFKS